MKRILLGLLVLVLLAGGAAYALRGQIALGVMERTAERTMASSVIDSLPDGLHVAICGAGGPLPDPHRGAPCTTVIAGKRMFVVDAGEGAGRVLGQMGLGSGNGVVLLTHFHSDHIDGISNVALQRWAGFNMTTPLALYGPPGVEEIAAGLNQAYRQDAGYRTAHHGDPVAPPSGAGVQARPFALPTGAESVVVLDEDGVKITAFRVDHGPVEPSIGYRFDYKGRSVVISGDTAPSPTLTAQSQGVDLLVHEALSPELVGMLRDVSLKVGKPKRAKIFDDILNYHTSPEDAARIATKAQVKALVLTHIIPPLPVRALEVPFLGKARSLYKGPLWIARDGDLFTLPAGGGDVQHKRLAR